jgi:HTH-type transcriptional regulator/antitoxin HigA
MAAEPGSWQHDWTVAPGEILLEAIQERDMSQSELARRMDRPIKTINEIVNGKTAITPDTAIQLELTLGVAASFWNNLEAAYRAQLARARSHAQLEAYGSWAAAFPIKELVRHKLIARGASKSATVAALLGYFQVSNPNAWEKHWLTPPASFRASPSYASSPHAAAAWLRWGELVAAGIQTEPFDAQRLCDVLEELRGMTRRDFALIRGRIGDLLASAGVAFVLTPELPGTRLSGAARWVGSDKAIIQLSLRHNTDDHLWFSLFHEARHLLRNRRVDFLDDEDIHVESSDDEELDADRFARDVLIAPEAYADFVAGRSFSREAVRDFAKQQDVAVGIVVGRLQRDGHLDRSHLNELKRTVRIGDVS